MGAVCGLLALGVFLGTAELAAGVVGQGATPTLAVGAGAVDAAPPQLKDLAVRALGERSKDVLLVGVVATLAALSAVAGAAAARRLALGLGAVGLLTAVTAVAALTRPTGRAVDALPALVGGLTAAVALSLLVDVGRGSPAPALEPAPGAGSTGHVLGRRRLLRYGLAVAAGAAAAGALGRSLLADASRTTAARLGIVLPPVGSPAPAPVGDPQAAGASPFFTPNADFYRVDTALTVPRLEVDSWTLRLHGMVDRPVTLTWSDLLELPLVERDITLTCVSNEVGGPYVGNARWTGVLLGPLLERAGLRPGATQVLSRSVDGWTCGTPTAVLTDGRDALLAVAMNGEPLPFRHGFPVRMVVPGLYGYVSATKWLTELELTTLDVEAYWISRGYAQQAPVKTSSRIDTPRPDAELAAGRVPIAGVAWAQHTGIAAVEVSVDGGPWLAARLAGEAGVDSWRQWVLPWQAEPGSHRLSVRAVDRAGRVQDATSRPIRPDGATGLHEVRVTVT
jgi:DMSO/TMAO reductase YedYZ molybdopterin-dependent catalytic subunit